MSMKPCLMALGLGAFGVLALRAEPVTEITGGSISRSYSVLNHNFLGETDDLTLHFSTGGVDFSLFSVNMTDSFPPYYGVTTFTDHVSASVVLSPTCPVCDPTFGAVNLDVTSYLNAALGPSNGPSGASGRFSASGSFTTSGITIPLIGGGTVHVGLQQFYDPDPGYFYYDPSFFQYNFIPVPEPAVMISTGLGLLSLVLGRRPARDANRPPRQD